MKIQDLYDALASIPLEREWDMVFMDARGFVSRVEGLELVEREGVPTLVFTAQKVNGTPLMDAGLGGFA